jgi:hypothetical protein
VHITKGDIFRLKLLGKECEVTKWEELFDEPKLDEQAGY